MHKLTFLGDPTATKAGAWQRHFCPLWPQGLAPGESVTVDEVPHSRIHGSAAWFLLDGKPYTPEKPTKTAKK